MITKEQLIEVFADTEKIYRADETLKAAVKNSIAGTKFFAAEDYPALPTKKFDATKISVTNQRTFEAAFQLRANNPNARIAVHNFASATNPGGGVKHGSRAQEEALCRCSTLYPVLNTDENWQRYYKFHRDRRDTIYTDACIFTPEIFVFKSDTDEPQSLPRSFDAENLPRAAQVADEDKALWAIIEDWENRPKFAALGGVGVSRLRNALKQYSYAEIKAAMDKAELANSAAKDSRYNAVSYEFFEAILEGRGPYHRKPKAPWKPKPTEKKGASGNDGHEDSDYRLPERTGREPWKRREQACSA